MARDNDDTLAINFWSRVDNACNALGITKQELCRKARLNYGSIINKRSQNKLPNLEESYAISKTLDRSLDWLLTGKEAKMENGYVCTDEYLLPIIYRLSMANKRQIDAISLILGL